MGNISGKSCSENPSTHFMYNISFPECRAVYEIKWKNMAEPGWPQMTVWRLRIAC